MAAMVAVPAYGQTTISTVSGWNGSTAAQSFGQPQGIAADAYGETFVVPAGEPVMSDINFRLAYNFGQGISFTGYLMAWDGTEATGSVLFESAPASVDSSTAGFAVFDFPIPSVALTPGNSYVFFVLASEGSGGPATAEMAVTGTPAPYTSGNFVFTNSGGVFGNLSSPWTQSSSGGYGDAVFSATFNPPAPAVTLSKSSVAYGSVNVGSTSNSQTVTMTNTGSVALTITSITVTGTNASQFVFANNCGTSLAAGANCSIHGHFAPTAGEASTAAVTITDNAADSPQTIALSGTGLAPLVTLSSASLGYGSVTVNTPSESQSVTLTNNGTVALSITSIAVTGTNASSFDFANNCGTSVAIGGSCTIHGHFAPTALGGATAQVTITDNAPDSPESIALSGTGAAATSQVTLSGDGLPAGSSPTNLVFGSVDVNQLSASQTVIVTNTGTTTLTFTSITVAGSNAGQFPFANSCGGSLAVGATCLIHGHFAPTGLGPVSAAITLIDSSSDSPQSIALSGTGVAQQLSFSAMSLSYAPTIVGSSSGSQSITMTNVGATTVTIGSIALTGTDPFAFVFANNCGTSLAAGASCTIHGHFAPTTTGPLTATITITDSAGDSPETIGLSGTGNSLPAEAGPVSH